MYKDLPPEQQRALEQFMRMRNPVQPLIMGQYDTMEGEPATGAAPEDSSPTVEDGYSYTPGPGGRANPSNWKPVAAGGAGFGQPGFPGPY